MGTRRPRSDMREGDGRVNLGGAWSVAPRLCVVLRFRTQHQPPVAARTQYGLSEVGAVLPVMAILRSVSTERPKPVGRYVRPVAFRQFRYRR